MMPTWAPDQDELPHLEALIRCVESGFRFLLMRDDDTGSSRSMPSAVITARSTRSPWRRWDRPLQHGLAWRTTPTDTRFAVRVQLQQLADHVGDAAHGLPPVHVMHRQPIGEPPRVDFFFQSSWWGGEPANLEPHKCSALIWHRLDQPLTERHDPVPDHGPTPNSIQWGGRFSVYGWQPSDSRLLWVVNGPRGGECGRR